MDESNRCPSILNVMIQELNQNVLNETREPAQSLCEARPRFNNVESSHPLNINVTELHRDTADFGEFYIRVFTETAQAVTNVISQVEQQDAVQLELRGDTLPQGVSCVVSGEEFDLTHLQSFLDRIVQSNTAVKTDVKRLRSAETFKVSSENHLKYVGPYPEPEAYGVKQMSREGKREFEAWYETVRHSTFNFEKEAVRYCQNDVDILVRACDIFRKGYIDKTGVDPFSCATITSACMKVFCTNFLRPDTLAIPSPDDYRRRHKTYSNAGVQWLGWVAHTEGVFIQHGLNAGEKQIGRYFVDGYAEVRGVKTAWEFQGFITAVRPAFSPTTPAL
ncbi:hypothetical protein ABVT39_010670 [Epinephelus coioides]